MSEKNDGKIDNKHPAELLWDAFNEARMNKSVAEYCEMSIDALKEECHGLKCLMKSVKIKMARNSECSKYDWMTKKRPNTLTKLANFYEKLRSANQKAEETLRAKELAAKEDARQYKEEMANERVKGWWDESVIESKKNAYLGKSSDREDAEKMEHDDEELKEDET